MVGKETKQSPKSQMFLYLHLRNPMVKNVNILNLTIYLRCHNSCLNFQKSSTSGCNDVRIGKFEFGESSYFRSKSER